MPDLLHDFLADINREKLRVKRPSSFIFLCGGVILSEPHAPSVCLRDFLWRKKDIASSGAAYVLAESAQQLYRDSGYSDLITFEEDIARIAAIVLVISESPGSLAELGAFCSNPIISPVLRLIISEENFNRESFIRWGPVQRVLSDNRNKVGVFPWLSEEAGDIDSTAEPHHSEIVEFISQQVDSSPLTTAYPADPEVSVFYDLLWAIYLADAVPPGKLYEVIQKIHPTFTSSVLRKKLYTLRVAGWVGLISYGSQDYYYLPDPQDPFQYSFKESAVGSKEPLRRVLSVREKSFDPLPPGVLARVRAARESR